MGVVAKLFVNGWLYRKRFNGQSLLDKPTFDQVILYEVKLVLSEADYPLLVFLGNLHFLES